MDMKNTIRVFIIFCKAVIISIQLKTFLKKKRFSRYFRSSKNTNEKIELCA